MTATLVQTHDTTKEEALAFLQDHANSLAAEEAEIADARVRYDAERIIELCDELADPGVCLRHTNFYSTH